SVVSSDLPTISASAELPPSCLRMASHRRPSRPSNDRTPERVANVPMLSGRVNRETFPKGATSTGFRCDLWGLIQAAFESRIISFGLRRHEGDLRPIAATGEVRSRRKHRLCRPLILPNQSAHVAEPM